MPDFFCRRHAPRHLLVLCLLGLLLAGCASKSLWDMSEGARNRAAARGNIEAIRFQQSYNYYDSNHVSHDRKPEEFLKWIRKGVELNDGASQYKLAYLSLYANETSLPVQRNPAEALRLARAAAGNHVQAAQELVARAEAIVKNQSLAEQGDAEAMYALSEAYAPLSPFGLREIDLKVERDRWLLKAAEAGQPEAAMAMANRTWGEESLRWKQKAAARDRPEAMFGIAETLHQKGDETAALEWYRKAAAKGYAPAKKPILQLTDPTVVRLKAAAKAGDAEAMYQLGEYFRAGNWSGKDAAIAQGWYGRAAGKGHVQGMYQAALGITINAADQERAMRAAAAAGSADAAAWVASKERWQAAETQRKEQEAEAARRQAEAKAQQQLADQQAFVARIDREGSTDMYTVEQYCKFGGRRCDALRVEVRRAQERGNAAAASANMQRIQNYTSNDGKTQEQRDKEYRDRLACTQRNTQAIQNNTYGKTDWSYKKCD